MSPEIWIAVVLIVIALIWGYIYGKLDTKDARFWDEYPDGSRVLRMILSNKIVKSPSGGWVVSPNGKEWSLSYRRGFLMVRRTLDGNSSGRYPVAYLIADGKDGTIEVLAKDSLERWSSWEEKDLSGWALIESIRDRIGVKA